MKKQLVAYRDSEDTKGRVKKSEEIEVIPKRKKKEISLFLVRLLR